MAQIVPKLNLNKTPAVVESNSLIFSKNIRCDVDGSIHRDYGVFPLSIYQDNTNTLINYKNIINRIICDIENEILINDNIEQYYKIVLNKLKYISGNSIDINGILYKNGTYKIVGIIADSNDFYIFINGTYTIGNVDTEKYNVNAIIHYSEKLDKFYPCNCNWNWSGGTIYGCIINNLAGDKILNICESGTLNIVPFKSINLNISNINDDESVYTQTPNIPLTNLSYSGIFSYVIPNGVYQFFVRYKIKNGKNFYSNWIPASNEIFVGNENNVITSFGTLKYTNIHRDSDKSFILSVKHLIDDYKNNYESYQLGFILSHDDAIYARAWKHFDFDTSSINFDYKAEDAEEIEVTDLLKLTYGLYNVNNVTTFKNKLYISNYTETDFNDINLQETADNIDISLAYKSGGNSYGGYPTSETSVANIKVIEGLIVNDISIPFTGENGIFKTIIERKSDYAPSIKEAIENAINGSGRVDGYSPDLYNIRIHSEIQSLSTAKTNLENKYKNNTTTTTSTTYKISYDNYYPTIVKINDKTSNKDSIISSIYNISRYLTTKCKWVNASGELNDTIKINIGREATIKETTIYYGTTGGVLPSAPDDELQGSDDVISRPITGVGGGSGPSTITRTFNVTYYQNINIKFIAFETQYSGDSAVDLVNNTTLIPYQKYKFYIHFVKSTGETTNGYYCSKAGELEAPYMASCTSVIYPIFKNIIIPNGYSACFFSILHTKNNSSTLFNITENVNDSIYEASCLEANMMLNPVNKNIHIKQSIINNTPDVDIEIPLIKNEIKSIIISEKETYSGIYYNSNDSSKPRYFGADGIITFDKTGFDKNKLAYIINDYNISESENLDLIKCTPYLTKNILEKIEDSYYFDEYSNMNLLGYICAVNTLLRDTCIEYYSDGSGVFKKSYNTTDGIYINLKELSQYNVSNENEKIANFSLKTSITQYIYSNYNLNYVTLSEEPKMVIKTFYNRGPNDNSITIESQKEEGNTIVLKLLSSQLMSDVYTLPSMYKSFTRKTYNVYNNSDKIRFDNTIRSSVLYGEENRINILEFEANDYYNIPTNRGIIINMIAVGDSIIVHTQDSMFRFSGSNTIQAFEGEIQTPESKPFDTGVSEVFGSDFGFAGIQNKSDHIITENGYIFFDRDSRIVYMYSGQGQIVKISDSIEKLFRHKNISNINFANDYYNNRFFMSIIFYDSYIDKNNNENIVKNRYYPVTLSFNTSEQIKSFISLHDFYYDKAFNTKTKCYFITEDKKDICSVNKNYKGCYSKLELIDDKTYPQKFDTIKITAKDNINSEELKEYNINSFNSIIDVIVNTSYEQVKTLNAINWCGNKILKEFTEIDSSIPETLMVAEDINYEIPCKYIRVYTDTCMSLLNDCSSRANDKSIYNLDSYKLPRYNQGFWTFSYFRNILKSNNNLKEQSYISDDNSLIEGKYFIIRFIFDKDFKFETLSLNYDIKL